MNGALSWVRVYGVIGVLVCIGFVLSHAFGWYGFNWMMPNQRAKPVGYQSGYMGRTYHK